MWLIVWFQKSKPLLIFCPPFHQLLREEFKSPNTTVCFLLPLSALTVWWFGALRALSGQVQSSLDAGLEHSSSSGTAFSRSRMSSPPYSCTVVRLLNTSHLCENFTSCPAHRSLLTVLSLLILCLAHGISHYEYIDWSGAGDAGGPLCRFLGLFSCVTALSDALDCRLQVSQPRWTSIRISTALHDPAWGNACVLESAKCLHTETGGHRACLSDFPLFRAHSPGMCCLLWNCCLTGPFPVSVLSWLKNGTLHSFSSIFSLHESFPKSFNTNGMNPIFVDFDVVSGGSLIFSSSF